LLLPAGAACAVLADPIVRLVYERGAFTPRQTEVVAEALAAFSLGLAFNGAMLMLNRAFFSLQSPWLPTGVALANLGLNAVLDAAFYPLGVWGIPLATSVVNIVGALALIELLRRRVGDVEAAETGRSALLILLASGALAVVARSAWQGLDAALGRSLGAQLTAVALALAAGALSYLVGCLLLGVRETRPLLALLGGRRS
ncbi:MAG: hypothetical protein C4305_05815, partial [Thermoleophilia bacterium]